MGKGGGALCRHERRHQASEHQQQRPHPVELHVAEMAHQEIPHRQPGAGAVQLPLWRIQILLERQAPAGTARQRVCQAARQRQAHTPAEQVVLPGTKRVGHPHLDMGSGEFHGAPGGHHPTLLHLLQDTRVQTQTKAGEGERAPVAHHAHQ